MTPAGSNVYSKWFPHIKTTPTGSNVYGATYYAKIGKQGEIIIENLLNR